MSKECCVFFSLVFFFLYLHLGDLASELQRKHGLILHVARCPVMQECFERALQGNTTRSPVVYRSGGREMKRRREAGFLQRTKIYEVRKAN